jgi:hypothetical protein
MREKRKKPQKSTPSLQQDIKSTLNQLPEILSNILGKTLPGEANNNLSKLKKDVLPNISNLDNDLKSIKTTDSLPLQIKGIFQSLNGLAPMLGAPDGVPISKIVIEGLEKYSLWNFEVPAFLATTQYATYLQTAKKLIQDVYSTTPLKRITTFIDNVTSSDDTKAKAPTIASIFPNNYKFLRKERKRFTKTSIDKYITIYDELAGVYEKDITFIIGLIKLTEGKAPKYSTIRNKPLATKVKYLKASKYAPLAGNFDVFIRNAKAHKTYLVNVVKRKIEFYPVSGRGETQMLSYKEMTEKTTDLSALILVTSQMPGLSMIEFLRKLENISENV